MLSKTRRLLDRYALPCWIKLARPHSGCVTIPILSAELSLIGTPLSSAGRGNPGGPPLPAVICLL